MENSGKSWLTGCGCGCLSYLGFFVVTYGLCIGLAFAMWELADMRGDLWRGENAVVWGVGVAGIMAFIAGVVVVFVSQRMAFKRFEEAAPTPGATTDAAPPSADQAGQQAQAPGAGEPAKRGCLMPGVWLALSFLVTVVGLGFFGIMASGRERDGVMAAWIVAGPLGLVWWGSLAGLIVHFALKKASTGVRVGAPIGCGVLGAITLVMLVGVFFAMIWPEL